MKYKLTKHSKQRRQHHTIKEDKFLIDWLNVFDDKFNFKDFKLNTTYKINHKHSSVAIIKRTKNLIILITFRGFNQAANTWNFDENIVYCNETKNRDALYSPVHRMNYNNKIVKCGRIFFNNDNNSKYKLHLKYNLINKYDMPTFKKDIWFNTFKEVDNLIYKNTDNLYYLNEFKRIKQNKLKNKVYKLKRILLKFIKEVFR